MALIWAEGFAGESALAPLWTTYTNAVQRSQDTSLPASERAAAFLVIDPAKTAYDAAVAQAEASFVQTAAGGKARTHLLVVGVGNYHGAGLPGLTTSVFGAIKFTDWMLTGFQHPDRPLASVELLLSPADGMGDWKPSADAAARLGLSTDPGVPTLPSEPATFSNIKAAFGRWLTRAGTRLENAAFFYFSGHGVWKSDPFLLPEDAQLPTGSQGAANLIDINATQEFLFNTKPSIQCFFIDACQDTPLNLLQNIAANPGSPLLNPTNALPLPRRDAWRYFGSFIGRKAYGPDNDAPFFTQELIACLEKRGAANARAGRWRVTTSSLSDTLKAASNWRAEKEAQDIKFSSSTRDSSFTAEICSFTDEPEVFVQVNCEPSEAMPKGKMYVQIGEAPTFRTAPLPTDWFTPIAKTAFKAGVKFDPPVFAAEELEFDALPPICPVTLPVNTGGGGT